MPWAALAVPLATSAYPGLAERAETGRRGRATRRALAPVAVLTVVAVGGRGRRCWSRCPGRWPGSSSRRRRRRRVRAPCATRSSPSPRGWSATRLVALLTRALYARGLWRAPDGLRRRRLAARGRRRRRALRGAAGRRPGAGPGRRPQHRRDGRRARACWSSSPAMRRAGRAAGVRPRRRRRPSLGGAPRRRPPGCWSPGRWAPTRCPAAACSPPSAPAWPAGGGRARDRRGRHDGHRAAAARRRPCAALRAARRTGAPRRREVHGEPRRRPLRRPPDRRGAGHERRRGRHARALARSPRSAAAGAAVGVCGPPATEELFGFTAAGADFRPVGISAGPGAGRRRPRRRRSCAGPPPAPTWCTPTGCGPAWSPRPPGGWRGSGSGRWCSPCTTPLPGGGRAPAPAAAARSSGSTIRGADLVLAVSSDLADNARRLGARDVRVAPVARAAAAAGHAAPAPRCAPSSGSTTAGPLVVAVGRLHPQKGYDVLLDAVGALGARRPAAAGPAGRDRRRRARCTTSSPRAIRAERLPVTCCSAGAPTSPTCWAPPTSACCPRAGRAARSPPRRRCAPGTPLVATRTGGIPELVGDARGAGAGRRRRRAGRRRRPRARRSRRTPRRWPRPARGRPPAGPTRRPPPAGWSRVYRELLGAPADGRPVSRRGRGRGLLLAVLLALLAGRRRRRLRGDRDRRGRPGARRRRPGADLGRHRPRRGTPELWALAEDSADRRDLGARRPLHHLPARRLGHPRRGQPRPLPGPDEPSPRRAPMPGDGPRPAPADRRRPVDTRCPTAACRSRSPRRPGRPAATVARRRRRRATARFGAEPGALGQRPWAARRVVGRAAALAVAAPGVRRAPARTRCPPTTAALAGAAGRLPAHPRLARPAHRRRRSRASTRTDDGTDPPGERGACRASTPPSAGCAPPPPPCPADTLLLLQGISEVNDGRPQLHVGIGRGPGLRPRGWLTSAEHRPGALVQLIDVAPDRAARRSAWTAPASMNGQPLQVDRATGRALAEAVAELDRRQHRGRRALPQHRRRSSGCCVVDRASALLVVRSAAGPAAAAGAPGRRAVRPAAAAAGRRGAAARRWRWPSPRCRWPPTWPASCRGSAAARRAGALVAVAAGRRPGRRRRGRARARGAAHRLGPPSSSWPSPGPPWSATCSPARTSSSTACSATTRSSPAGSPATATSPSGCCRSARCCSPPRSPRVRRPAAPARRPWLLPARGRWRGSCTVGVIGAPALGRDFGGVLAALPGFLLLGDAAGAGAGHRRPAGRGPRRRRARRRRRRGAGLAAAARPAQPPGPVRRRRCSTGEAWTVVSRKAAGQPGRSCSAARWPGCCRSRCWPPSGCCGRAACCAAGPAGGPGGLAGRGRRGCCAPALTAVALSLAVGAAGQRLGVALPATAAALLVPLLVWLAAGAAGRGPHRPGSRRSPVRAGRGADRVTVVSRGSTGWNT